MRLCQTKQRRTLQALEFLDPWTLMLFPTRAIELGSHRNRRELSQVLQTSSQWSTHKRQGRLTAARGCASPWVNPGAFAAIW